MATYFGFRSVNQTSTQLLVASLVYRYPTSKSPSTVNGVNPIPKYPSVSSLSHMRYLYSGVLVLHKKPIIDDPHRTMPGESNLDTLLSTMDARLFSDTTFVFVTLPKDRGIPNGINPQMIFQEAEGTTLIVSKNQAQAHHLAFDFPCKMITLNVQSSLDAVGFLARVTEALAKHDMGVNPVAGFYHDHLFVPEGREHDAIKVLERMMYEAREGLSSRSG